MNFIIRGSALVIALVLLAGCATGGVGPKFDGERYSQQAMPNKVTTSFDDYRDSNVLWGGMLITTINQESGTQLEVLAYPLRENQIPDTKQKAIGRFLVIQNAYLEPLDYSPTRLITVAGKISEIHEGEVGSAEYLYPMIEADQMHLWPKNKLFNKPRINFSVGAVFGF